MEKEIESKAIEYLTGKPVERHHHEANYIVYQRPKSSNWFKIPTKEVNETIENHKESLKLQSRLPKSFSKMADGGGTKSAFDSTKEKMKDKTQQERIDSLIEFVSQSNWSSKPITVKDNMVIVFSKMYDLEPTRVASIFNKYQKKYAKGGGVGTWTYEIGGL